MKVFRRLIRKGKSLIKLLDEKRVLSSLKKQPLISIIIVIDKFALGLNGTLDSIYNCGYTNYEIVIVNHHGMWNDFASKMEFSKIKYINNEGRNLDYPHDVGIKNSKGEYVIFINPGDLLKRAELTRSVRFAIKKDLDIIFGKVKLEGYENILAGKRKLFGVMKEVNILNYSESHENNNLNGKIFRKSLIINNGLEIGKGYFYEKLFLVNCYLKTLKVGLNTNILINSYKYFSDDYKSYRYLRIMDGFYYIYKSLFERFTKSTNEFERTFLANLFVSYLETVLMEYNVVLEHYYEVLNAEIQKYYIFLEENNFDLQAMEIKYGHIFELLRNNDLTSFEQEVISLSSKMGYPNKRYEARKAREEKKNRNK